MKRWRKLKKNNDASLTAYVLILFGMMVMLYLFGFNSMWNIYTDSSTGVILTERDIVDPSVDVEDIEITETDTGITDPELNLGTKIFNILFGSIFSAILSSASIVGGIVFIWFFRNNQAIWQYTIPIILMVALNVFVFPISALQGDMTAFDASFTLYIGFSFTLILIAFFNLFYILAVLEFVRGGGST